MTTAVGRSRSHTTSATNDGRTTSDDPQAKATLD
jgi:hypothetical protein